MANETTTQRVKPVDSQAEVMRKIKAILRLANRTSSEGEGKAARAAAERLAKKAGISLEMLDESVEDIRTGILNDTEWHYRIGIEAGYITAILRNHFGVIMMQNLYGRKFRLSWIGTKVNIAIAKYVWLVLSRASRRDWEEVRKAKLKSKHVSARDIAIGGINDTLEAMSKLDKKSFMEGWFYVINKKLMTTPLRNDIEQFEAEKREAENALQRMKASSKMKLDIKKRLANLKGLDMRSIMMGQEAAEAVNLSRPLDGKESPLRPSLT